MPRKKQWNEWQVERRRIRAGTLLDRDAARRVVPLLDRSDQELLSVWEGGQVSNAALARVMNCHSATITRRIARLKRRISDPVAQTVAMCGNELPTTSRSAAMRIFVRGNWASRVARDLDLQDWEMKVLLAEVEGWARAKRHATTKEVNHAA